jgi:uncharacterized protein YegL
MKNFTDITILLDRSGSMASIKESMEQAFDKFIQEHKAVPTTKVTLIQFDDVNNQEVVYQCVPVGSVEKLNLKPRGNTPLIDAFVTAIDRTGERLASMNESDRPDQVLLVAITDGQENASRRFNRTELNRRVTTQRENYKWQFIYLGANQDAIAEAFSFGIPHTHALNYSYTGAGAANSLGALASNTVAYAMEQGAMRSKSVKSFTEDQRRKAADDNDDLVEFTKNIKKGKI